MRPGQKCIIKRKSRTNKLENAAYSRSGNILRFPRAAAEPPRAYALRGLT